MGHREDLLEGAKRCLHEKGYARTTARDLVQASGANLASIGYHYGSKEALLDAALLDAIGEMNDVMNEVLNEAMQGAGGFAAAWQRFTEVLPTYRPLLVAQVEAWGQIERSPQLRERFATFHQDEIVRGTQRAHELNLGLDDRTVRAIADVTNALADGVVLQWLIDPDRAPTGPDLTLGIRALADLMNRDDTTAQTDTKQP